MSFTKNYIGKGKQVTADGKAIDIIRVTISEDRILEIMASGDMVEYDGNRYLVFEVAKLNSPDAYGKTHTAYISIKEEDEIPVAKPIKTSKPKKEKALAEDVLPF